MPNLYPPTEPFRVHALDVGDDHTLYVEEAGAKSGLPVLFLHGGPGGGVHPYHRRFFDPARYRVILFDQRGAGQSAPHAALEHNTTWHLVDDIEKIRRALGIDSWLLFGGSWGSTLALTYAITHPERVRGLVLRGVFLLRERELRWFYQHGASELFPEAWDLFVDVIPPNERDDLLGAYHRRLVRGDAVTQLRAARAWTRWELSTSRLKESAAIADQLSQDDRFALGLARIEAHYFKNRGFLASDGWILENVASLGHIPCTIVQGRYDVVCPPRTAWDLKAAMPHADLRLVAEAGHASSEPGIASELVAATDAFARLLD